MPNIVKIDPAVEAGARALRILASVSFNTDIPILEKEPTVSTLEAGKLFWYNGDLWTYAKENQFTNINKGTPVLILKVPDVNTNNSFPYTFPFQLA